MAVRYLTVEPEAIECIALEFCEVEKTELTAILDLSEQPVVSASREFILENQRNQELSIAAIPDLSNSQSRFLDFTF